MSILSNALESLSAAFGKLRAALTPPPTTRVPLTNAEIKALRQTVISNGTVSPFGSGLDANLIVRVCNAALDARKRNRRYGRAMRDTLSVDA
jgi:hypothetical protein